MEIIRRLEIYRLENRITQQKLAEILKVSFSTINRWFNNKAKPNKIQVYHIKQLIDHHFSS